MERIKAVILAAGKGTRMKSELPKVIHTALGKPMVEYVIEAALGAGAHKEDICLVVGHKADMVKRTVGDDVQYVLQEEQLTKETLLAAVSEVYEERDKYRHAMESSSQQDSIQVIMNLIENVKK